jgi:ribosomal protein S17E
MTMQELKEKYKVFFKGDFIADEKQWQTLDVDFDTVLKDSVAGVITNRDTILTEKKKLEEQFKQIQDQFKPFVDNDVKFEDYKRVQEELEIMKSKSDPGDLKELEHKFYEQGKKTQLQELEPKLKDLETKYQEATKLSQSLKNKYVLKMKETEIRNALSDLNVEADQYWMKGFFESAEHTYHEMEDKLHIEVPNPLTPGQMMPIKDWKTIFPGTPEGKRLIKAPLNGGSGAGGSGGKGHPEALSLEYQIGQLFRK